MMLADLSMVLSCAPPTANSSEITRLVVEENILNKPTSKARALAAKHLTTLYGCDPSIPVFRTLRQLWAVDASAQPLLALAVALARDPLLRASEKIVLSRSVGEPLSRADMEEFLESEYPGRFSPASLRSFAQNLNGTWTDAGFLHGRHSKARTKPVVAPVNMAMGLFLGYLEGKSGQALFSSRWIVQFGLDSVELEKLATAASNRGLLVFMNAGGVKEIRFPGQLSSEEECTRQEASHVL